MVRAWIENFIVNKCFRKADFRVRTVYAATPEIPVGDIFHTRLYTTAAMIIDFANSREGLPEASGYF